MKREAPLDLHERCRNVELLLMDVDGVLTDGGILYTDAGAEIKAFHVRDGGGVRIWVNAGKRAGILSGRKSAIVERRAVDMGLTIIEQGIDDKREAFERILAGQQLRADQACFVGDDVVDLPVLRRCGFAVAVADACDEAKAHAHYVTKTPGGRGAVREIVELLLRAQGRWDEMVERFLA